MLNAIVATAAKRWSTLTTTTTVWRRWLLSAWLLSVLIFISTLPISAGEPSEAPSKSILKWSSGDQLAGQVVELVHKL